MDLPVKEVLTVGHETTQVIGTRSCREVDPLLRTIGGCCVTAPVSSGGFFCSCCCVRKSGGEEEKKDEIKRCTGKKTSSVVWIPNFCSGSVSNKNERSTVAKLEFYLYVLGLKILDCTVVRTIGLYSTLYSEQ